LTVVLAGLVLSFQQVRFFNRTVEIMDQGSSLHGLPGRLLRQLRGGKLAQRLATMY